MQNISNKSIVLWLLISIILVYLMVIIGGYTRLTHSGLSIVEWKPISGIIPPLNQPSWDKEFYQYKKSPEFLKINYSMNIEEFKQIFLVEYFHRIVGRITGLVFILPFLYFSFTNRLTRKESAYFLLIGTLIALQGGIGWFMVKSGLINQPNVSQYRLALHLLMACIILIMLVWKITPNRKSALFKYGCCSIFLLLSQIISGAFVAGLHAGLVYNSFPLMDGKLIPDGLFFVKPFYLNIFENIITVQFIHRYLGIINVINILIYCYRTFNRNENRLITYFLAILVVLQLILGISTLILQVPLILALLHQALAIILLIILVASLKNYHRSNL